MNKKILFFLLIFCFKANAYENKLFLFKKPLSEYRIKNYVGENVINRIEGPDGEVMISHQSNNSASGLFHDINIDLRKKN